MWFGECLVARVAVARVFTVLFREVIHQSFHCLKVDVALSAMHGAVLDTDYLHKSG
jgi:hypothetical protein